MWWSRDKQTEEVAVQEAVPTVRVPVSKAVSPDLADAEFAEYESLATQLGIAQDGGALLNERISRVLRDENIHIYDLGSVNDYLNHVFGVGEWEWRGLRKSDTENLGGWWMSHGEQRIGFSKREYTDKVPLPVLLTVKKIADRIPEAHFFVSAPIAKDGDPFLMVCAQRTNGFVVERWDEPNFRER